MGGKLAILDEEIQLNKRQKAFCENYIVDFNATQSYLKTYKTDKEATAGVNASKLLGKPEIRLYIQKLIQEKVSEELTPNRILYELMSIAFDHEVPYNERIKALTHLSKLMGMEVTKVQMEQIIFVGENEMMD